MMFGPILLSLPLTEKRNNFYSANCSIGKRPQEGRFSFLTAFMFQQEEPSEPES